MNTTTSLVQDAKAVLDEYLRMRESQIGYNVTPEFIVAITDLSASLRCAGEAAESLSTNAKDLASHAFSTHEREPFIKLTCHDCGEELWRNDDDVEALSQHADNLGWGIAHAPVVGPSFFGCGMHKRIPQTDYISSQPVGYTNIVVCRDCLEDW